MKNIKSRLKLSAISVLLGLASSSLYAEEAFLVKGFQLSGALETLSEDAQLSVAKSLSKYQGTQTLTNLKTAQLELQAVLDKIEPNKFDVILPQQTITDGNIIFELVSKSVAESQVFYKASKGYSEENIARSLPSLKQGKVYEDGRQWFDLREFNMAKENPLKVTRVHYELNPKNKTSNLIIAGFSPFGKTRSFISYDNFGAREFNYQRVSLGFVNANLTGHDDVLNLNALTNVKAPSKSYAVGVGYTYPFYSKHQSLSLYTSMSYADSNDIDGLPSAINRKLSKGQSISANLKWSYYLPTFNLGMEDQFKINLGYNYRHINQTSELNRLGETKKKFAVSGVSAGIDGHIQFTPKTIFNIDLTHHYYASKLPGSFGMERIGETFNRSYHISTASLGLSQEFAQGWHFSSQLSGQFTLQDISSIDLFSVTGTYGVRGFKYGGASGERGLVWRNELSMPKYTRFQISPYAFYDAGQFRYNSENAKTYGEDMHTVSSAGLGIKTSPTQNLSLDAFVARRFANANSDNLNGNKKRTSSPTTFWGRLTFSF